MTEEQLGEVVNGRLKGQKLRSVVDEDGSWKPWVVMFDADGDDRRGYRHLGDGKYLELPGEMIWYDEYRVALDPSQPLDDWPEHVIVERWQFTHGGERRMIESRVYNAGPADEIPRMRELEGPRWLSGPEIEEIHGKTAGQ